MNKQAVSVVLLERISNRINLKIFTLLVSGLLVIPSAQSNQTDFLDSNGIPLTDEFLMSLTSSSENFDQNIKSEDSSEKNLSKTKKKSIPNAVLEEELFEAMKVGDIQRVKQLLRAGTAPTFKNNAGETPLGIAVSRGWASMVIELLEKGANINEKGARGVTLIHVASSKGLIDVAKVLVRNGLSPSKTTDKDWTSLHVAARYNHWQLVQYFVSLGVDPDIRNSDGQTALGLARHLGHQSIIKILSQVTTRSSLNFASKKKRRK